jgi:hypothetical protein
MEDNTGHFLNIPRWCIISAVVQSVTECADHATRHCLIGMTVGKRKGHPMACLKQV